MIEIDVKRGGGIEKALKELKKKWNSAKTAQQLRARHAYVKPSVKRRNEIQQATYTEKVRRELDAE